jgi:undecaprenyl phosphate N,N'-diacetylbacillosamine 1-phosphate transferase
MYRLVFKPTLDFLFALVLLLILLPFLFIIGILVYIIIGGPVLFIQLRPGKNHTIFKLYKFRTMTDKRDSSGKLLEEKERLTRFGLFLRRNSLDELPQLINILKGNLSFIGPRPLLVEYLSIYSEDQKRRHLIKPGITGWAQVNGRNTISWEEKFKLDLWYIDNLSFILDIKICLKTIVKVLKREGISKNGYATTVAFNGHN